MEKEKAITLIDAFKDFKEEKNIDGPVMMGVLKDVFLNIAGGLRVNDPAIDLAVLAAVLSSNMDIPLDSGTCLAGEVGLAGEIRPVSRLDQRIQEAQKLGFRRIIIPAGQQFIQPKQAASSDILPIEIIPVKKVSDAFRILFQSAGQH